jgi:large subunit ribosomal protein L22
MAEDIRAVYRYCARSPQKVRLVADTIRGKPVTEALAILQFTPKTAAREVELALRSAVANGEENFGASRDDLFVHRIEIDGGPTRRWRRFGARGRFKPILRRTSHITVVLREKES